MAAQETIDEYKRRIALETSEKCPGTEAAFMAQADLEQLHIGGLWLPKDGPAGSMRQQPIRKG
jgi:hypothetical protein